MPLLSTTAAPANVGAQPVIPTIHRQRVASKNSAVMLNSMGNWQRRAECATAPPRLFDHPADGGRLTVAQAANVDDVIAAFCDWCPVRTDCLRQALNDKRDGIAGGQLVTHRHGNLTGYNTHLRSGEKPCPGCKEAKNAYYNAYHRDYRARMRQRP